MNETKQLGETLEAILSELVLLRADVKRLLANAAQIKRAG